MVKRRTSGAILAPELEQARLALWPSQPPAARALWLQVLSTLLPPHTRLLEALTDIPAFRDWRQTVGMFADDPIIDAITEAGQRIRAAERTPA